MTGMGSAPPTDYLGNEISREMDEVTGCHYKTRNSDSLSVPNIRPEAGRNRLSYSAVQGPNGLRRTQGRAGKATVRRHVLSELSGNRLSRCAVFYIGVLCHFIFLLSRVYEQAIVPCII